MTDLTKKARRLKAIRDKRHRSERLFRLFALGSVCVGLIFLAVLFGVVLVSGVGAFKQTMVQLDVSVAPKTVKPGQALDPETLKDINYQGLVKRALRETFPEARSRRLKRQLYDLLSNDAAFVLQKRVSGPVSAIFGRSGHHWFSQAEP